MGAGPAGGAPTVDEAVLSQAYNAFKKRYKLTVLDHDSRLGANRPMTGGKTSKGMGIQPPGQFAMEAYKELARRGRIKDLGGGFFAMP